MARTEAALIMVFAGLCIFIFLAFLLAYGQLMGGNWTQIAQGVTKYILVVVVFMFAAFVIVILARRK